MRLEGSVAVVTGGGTGIGAAVANGLAAAGARAVVVNYSTSADEAEATAASLREAGCDAAAERADVADDEQVKAMARRVLDRYGQVHILINNAATTVAVPHADLDALTDQMWQHVFGVNVLGAFHCARAFAPALSDARGAIVNVSSISGYRAGGSSIVYGVSKAALLQLTRNLAATLAPRVRVNAVAPGMVATRWQVRLHGEQGFDERSRAEAAATPLRQVSTARDVADAIIGLLGMDLVTGEALIVDGGKHVLY